MNGIPAPWMVGPEASTESVSVKPTTAITLSCSINCLATWAVTSILYWVSWTTRSIGRPSTPPAALISLAASLAPLAAGRSSDDSSPVSAKPPPTLIGSPEAAGALVAAAPAVGAAAAVASGAAVAAGALVAAGAAVGWAAGAAPPHAASASVAIKTSSRNLGFMFAPFR